MTSSAFSDLTGRLHEVRLLCQLDPLRSGDLDQLNTTNAINRACIILLSAHLEGFLEDLVVEAIDALVDGTAKVEQLPLVFRALHAEEHLRVIEPIKDRKARAPRIEQMFKGESELWLAGKPLQATMVRAKMVCGEMTNPGSREIRQFLELLGVDIELCLAITGKDELLNQINGLVGRRNAIAHGEVNASATSTDVDNYRISSPRDSIGPD